MEKITNTTRAFFRMCAAISFSGFTEMAPTLTPLAPAAFFAVAIATAFFDRLPESLTQAVAIGMAIVVGLVAAGGLEAAGFMAFHSAIEAYRYGAGWRAGILPGLYLVIGITALWVVEEAATATIGTALFLLAATVYAARMVMHDAKAKAKTAVETEARQAEETAAAKARQVEQAAAQLAFELEQARADRELERQLLLKKADADAAAHLARIQVKAAAQTAKPAPQAVAAAKPAPEPAKFYECSCGAVFDKPQSYSAHRRHCDVGQDAAAIVKQNGHLNGATQ
jgi:hypothetical protein